ncbi:hypothetical protein RJT34_30254 [Clitoria ternatea]|uniref:Uncharacterized protein n=1 Tax=Clitoria ternatea TaxID=43366 RepID=A0AAN9ES14_CLITE
MGGGGAMRTAAKIATIGVGKSSLRGSPGSLPTDKSVRNTSRHVSVAGVSSSQGAKAAEVAPLHAAAPWDDWEFADDGEVDMPRVLFGSVPSFDEAKEATSELKEAIDKIYLSPNSSQSDWASPHGQVSVLPPFHEPVNKSCVLEAIYPSVPNHAIQAFQLLSTSSEAQSVVASIACDPNVWKAVMENPAVNNFFQSQQTVADFEEKKTTERVEICSDCASEVGETPEKMEALHECHRGIGSFDFMCALQKLKLTVTELVSRVSGFLQNIFPIADTVREKFSASGNPKGNFMESKTFLGGTFMGLAVLVIMVILSKRA